MATKSKGAKVKGNQTVAFKRHMSFGPSDENVIEITPAYPPPKPKPPRKYQCFGFADDGGRYELLLNAIARGRLKLTKTLISLLPLNSAADARTPDGGNGIMLALEAIEDPKRRRRMMELLFEHGSSVKYVNPNTGETVVHLCSGKIPERLGDLKWFLNRWPVEMDISKTDLKGNNALHWAVMSGDFAAAVILLRLAYKNYTDLDKPNSDKMTPYLLAHKLGFVEIAEIIDKTASCGISALDQYLTKSARTNSGRRSVRDENDIIFPALVNHTLPSRFDGFEMPVRNRTAIREEGDEDRLTQSLDSTMKKRVELLVRGQPEHLPRVALPSAIVRREIEESRRIHQHRSLQNLDETLSLLPDYAVAHEQKTQGRGSVNSRPNIRKILNVGKITHKAN